MATVRAIRPTPLEPAGPTTAGVVAVEEAVAVVVAAVKTGPRIAFGDVVARRHRNSFLAVKVGAINEHVVVVGDPVGALSLGVFKVDPGTDCDLWVTRAVEVAAVDKAVAVVVVAIVTGGVGVLPAHHTPSDAVAIAVVAVKETVAVVVRVVTARAE